MAEVPTNEPVPCSSEGAEPLPEAAALDAQDEDEPSAKKRKLISDREGSDKLEHRLGGILCCAVCLDLPQAAVYQCSNGHLMCAPCFTHLLADARLRDEAATCPNCRVEISRVSASRNLAVEKTVSELPSECKFCTKVFPRHSLAHHEDETCEERKFKFSQIVVDSSATLRSHRSLLDGLVRIVSGVYVAVAAYLAGRSAASGLGLSLGLGLGPSAAAGPVARKRRRPRRLTTCQWAVIGCGWRGPAHEAPSHGLSCPHPARSAADVAALLADRDLRARTELAIYTHLVDLLSYEKITFNDLQLKPYRTEEFVHKLYYETSRFSAFGQQWVVKAFINKNQRDPTQSTQREITYQLILKGKCVAALPLQWVWLRGPWGEARVSPKVSSHVFAEDSADAPALPLPLLDPQDANRLLANKAIHFRLIMFLTSK